MQRELFINVVRLHNAGPGGWPTAVPRKGCHLVWPIEANQEPSSGSAQEKVRVQRTVREQPPLTPVFKHTLALVQGRRECQHSPVPHAVISVGADRPGQKTPALIVSV